MINSRFSAACLCLFIACFAAPRAHAETLLLSGATVHTVTGETLSPGEVLIKDGKIAEVGKSISVRDSKRIELKGRHLYPGLIALNSALGLVEISAVRATRDAQEVGEYTPDVESWIAVNPDSELLPVTRAAGVSHFQPVPRGGVVAGQSALMTLAGWTPEQMTIRAPAALHVFWPGFHLETTPREKARDRSRWKSLDDQAKDRRARVRAIEDFFEEARAVATAREVAGTGAAPQPPPNPAWDAMLPFARRERPLIIHADDVRQIQSAVSWAHENEYPVILAGGRDAWMIADWLAARKVPVIFEHTFTLPPRDTDPYDVHFRAPDILRRAGVTVVFSTGVESTSFVRNLAHHAAHAVAFGLPRDEALKGLTLHPAHLMGVAERLGSIEAGKEATLIVADRDILDVRSNVERMWIAGREVSLENRHTRLYEKYRNRPKE